MMIEQIDHHNIENVRGSNGSLLRVQNIRKWFPIHGTLLKKTVRHVKAVDDVTFEIAKGETLGLVGESGSGKTTLGRIILHLLKPTDGAVYYDGKLVTGIERKIEPQIRKEMQIIFQDPFSSLNPRLTVGSMLREVLHVHKIVPENEITERIVHLLELVGLNANVRRRYPHEFSGGQRQRIGIARALAVQPQFIVCDEPVSSLDVSIQSQILNLLQDLQEKFSLTYLFIAHDLTIVEHMADRVAVMYLGKIVEMAAPEELFIEPKHPYTQLLLSSIPIPNPHQTLPKINFTTDVQQTTGKLSGCAFYPRCSHAFDQCQKAVPEFISINPHHSVRCFLYGESKLNEYPSDLHK